MTTTSINLGQLEIDDHDIYWLEGRPLEGGRYALVRCSPGHDPEDCLPAGFNVRTRVHEYGGAAFAVFDGIIFFVNFKDQHLYRLRPGGFIEVLTPSDGYRYADIVLDRLHKRLICVREDHINKGEAINTIIAIPLNEGGDGVVLEEGYNFYSNPRLSPDGSLLAWLCWNHPNMPWDGCELWSAEILPNGKLGEKELVAGGKDESIFQPEWSPKGVLYFVSDRSGWWNFYRKAGKGVENLYPLNAEFGEPQWIFGLRTYDFISEREIICTYTENGAWKLARLDTEHKKLTPIKQSFSDYGDLRAGNGFFIYKAGSATQPTSICKLDLKSGKTGILKSSFEPTIDRSYFSVPQVIEFPTEKGLTAYGIFYPPVNPDYTAPAGETPPLVVISHGGPTSSTGISLNYGIQFWTSRGFAVLDVNYGGSSGYGRKYRMRLNGNWGVVDVDDCCNGALWLARQGLVDRSRLAVRGGSAGGYTTLAALVFKKVFSAGASYYGVSDLEGLATDTHKFESRYLDNLVGPYPASKDLYLARSPIHHLQDLTTPIILFQGDEDKVVPPAQSEMMFAAVKDKGIPVAYLHFAGEQHGFRKAENIKRSYESEYYFYSKIFKFDLGEEIDPVKIENL